MTLNTQNTDLTIGSTTTGDAKYRLRKLTNKVKMFTKFGMSDSLNPNLRKFNSKASTKDLSTPKD
jgi:hypothetical protein